MASKTGDDHHGIVDLTGFTPAEADRILLYERNMDVLGKRHPELAEMLKSIVIDRDKIRVLHSESGHPRLLYKKESGEEVYIHSASDPINPANQAVDMLGKMGKEGVIVLLGFGLGYFAEEVYKRFEKGHVLLVYEAEPEIFKMALHLRNFSELFGCERVEIMLGEKVDGISTVNRHYNHILNGRFLIVKHHPSVKLNEMAYVKFVGKLEEEHIAMKSDVVTGMGLGNKFIDNFLENIPSVLRKPGVTKLKDIFRGRPAILISAGPSLDKNIHLLKKAKGKAILIAVEAALPTLIPCDIYPDIVVALDPLEKNIYLIKDNPFLKKICFVCLPQFTTDVVRMYPGPLLLNSLPGNIAYQWLERFWEDKGFIECYGGSVAHFAFGTAEFLGSDTIAFVGQDLSFKREKSHTKGFKDISDQILEEALRKNDMKDVIDETAGTLPMEDVFGEQVLTRTDFLSFKTSFEKKLKDFKGTVINATEGGLAIEGAKNMRLDDFIDEYCKDLGEIDTFQILSSLPEDVVGYNLEELITEVTAGRDRFRKIRKTADRILKYVKRVQKLKEKGFEDTVEFHNILTKIETLTEDVKHPMLTIMVSYYFSLELFLIKQEMQEIDDIEDKWERLDKQIERGERYYGEIIKAIDLFNRQLDKLIPALRREERVNAILMDPLLEEDERFHRVAMIYKKARMLSQAVKYLEAIFNGRGAGARDVSMELAEMYLKQFRFYEAKDLLKSVHQELKNPASEGVKQPARVEGKRVEEMLIFSDEKIKEWEEKKKRMVKFIENAENNYGGHLESGYFYFRVKAYEKAEEAYRKAIQEGAHLSSAYYGLAHTHLAANEPEKAFDAFEKALEADPQNPLLYRDIGFMAFQNNNMESAEMFFRKALELAPETEDLYKLLGDLYITRREMGKAIQLYEDAAYANPNNLAFQQSLMMLYRDRVANTGKV